MQQPQQQYPQQVTYPQQQAYPQQGYPQQPQQYPPTGYQPVPGQPVAPQQAQYVAPQQTTIIQQSTHQKKIWEDYNANASRILGWIQIVLSILCIVLNIVGIVAQKGRDDCYVNTAFYIGAGFWCSIFFLISGGYALGAAKHKTTCMIVANMVMSIISAVIALALLGTAAGAVGTENEFTGTYYCWNYGSYGDRPNDGSKKLSLAMGTLMLLLSLLEIVVVIASSAYSCKAVCCGRRTPASYPQGATVQYVTTNTGQTTVIVPQTGAQQAVVQPQAGPGQYPAYQQPGVPPQYSVQQQEPVQPQYGAQQPVQPYVGPTAPPAYEDINAVKR